MQGLLANQGILKIQAKNKSKVLSKEEYKELLNEAIKKVDSEIQNDILERR